jgi:radical S-adenosyl methionine domain-containing protein 2
MHVKTMSRKDAYECIEKLAEAGVQKITFAGGEPMLYKHLNDCIVYAKMIGMTTSIITNGSLITEEWLQTMHGFIDWVGVSVDSLLIGTNIAIGRTSLNTGHDYWRLVNLIHHYGYKLKINTVVNAHNHNENLNHFISFARPDRWKVFQTLRVEGQNDTQFDAIKCTNEQFNAFISRHAGQLSLVPENNEAMTGSYLLIDPQGRLFENSSGTHTYSDSLINNSFDHCIKQINLNREMFIKRGGIYEW